MEPQPSVAFLTGASQPYARLAGLLMASLSKHHPEVPRYLAAMGSWGRQPWCDHLGVTVYQVDMPYSAEAAYYKPLCIRRCPAKRIIWIDSDAVLLRKLPDFFFNPDNFIIFEECFAERHHVSNRPSLYGDFPSDPRCVPNTGVLAIDHDDPLLSRWCENVEVALKNYTLRKYISFWDQGCLILAMHQLHRTKDFCSDRRFNYPANGLACDKEFERTNYDLADERVLARIEADHPEVYIVHWPGNKKLGGLPQRVSSTLRR